VAHSGSHLARPQMCRSAPVGTGRRRSEPVGGAGRRRSAAPVGAGRRRRSALVGASPVPVSAQSGCGKATLQPHCSISPENLKICAVRSSVTRKAGPSAREKNLLCGCNFAVAPPIMGRSGSDWCRPAPTVADRSRLALLRTRAITRGGCPNIYLCIFLYIYVL
jgi:hypothetical protein